MGTFLEILAMVSLLILATAALVPVAIWVFRAVAKKLNLLDIFE